MGDLSLGSVIGGSRVKEEKLRVKNTILETVSRIGYSPACIMTRGSRSGTPTIDTDVIIHFQSLLFERS